MFDLDSAKAFVLLEELLQRCATIGSRLDRLYRIAFQTTYFDDLSALGYGQVRDCLAKVHKSRNEFAHGNPRALDDTLVLSVVSMLKAEHESWIAGSLELGFWYPYPPSPSSASSHGRLAV